jgi:hypothetical protein
MKSTSRRSLTPLAILAAWCLGCGTTYSPRESGRIHFLMSGTGEDVIEKDGKTYKVRGFSRDLALAVSGNPAAEEHANIFVSRQRVAIGLELLASAAILAGWVFLYSAITMDPTSIDRRRTAITSLSMFAIGAASGIGGGIVDATSRGHLEDAVNIYNDDAARR